MKKILTIILAALLGGIAAQAQEADYQPLVREGVRWVNRFQINNFTYDRNLPAVYYMLELRGDTVVSNASGQHAYKKCYRTLLRPSNPEADYAPEIVFSQSTPAALLREEDKKVFCVMETDLLLHHQQNEQNDEFLLYDFSDGQQATVGWFMPDWLAYSDYTHSDFSWSGETICINGVECRIYQRGTNLIIDGIGLVSDTSGDMMTTPVYVEVSVDYNIGLCHVIDADGNIIYRGPNWHFFASDLNGDCKVDIADVSQAVNAILGRSDNPGTDINGDGKVDIGDVNAVINVMLGKE